MVKQSNLQKDFKLTNLKRKVKCEQNYQLTETKNSKPVYKSHIFSLSKLFNKLRVFHRKQTK